MESVGFEGVLYAATVSFTSTSDRSAFAFLYDNFVVEWLPDEAGEEDSKTASRAIALAAGGGTAGSTIVADLRGASFGNLGADARLTFMVGTQSVDVPLSRDQEKPDFYQRVEHLLEQDGSVTNLSIEAVLPRPDPAGTQATIQIDSVDVVLTASAEAGCGQS
jgi:hypothetical protein